MVNHILTHDLANYQQIRHILSQTAEPGSTMLCSVCVCVCVLPFEVLQEQRAKVALAFGSSIRPCRLLRFGAPRPEATG